MQKQVSRVQTCWHCAIEPFRWRQQKYFCNTTASYTTCQWQLIHFTEGIHRPLTHFGLHSWMHAPEPAYCCSNQQLQAHALQFAFMHSSLPNTGLLYLAVVHGVPMFSLERDKWKARVWSFRATHLDTNDCLELGAACITHAVMYPSPPNATWTGHMEVSQITAGASIPIAHMITDVNDWLDFNCFKWNHAKANLNSPWQTAR